MRWRCSRTSATSSPTRFDQLGKFSALAADSVNQTKDVVGPGAQRLGPVLESLANAGPALTRSLSLLPTFPFPKETLTNWMRGDYANLTADRRPDVEPASTSVLHRHPVGGRPDRAGDAVGPHHRPDCPARYTARQSAGRSLPLRPGALTCDLTRRIRIQLAIFAVVAARRRSRSWSSRYMRLPGMLFGVGHYTVTVELPRRGGLYRERQRHLPRHRGRPRRQRQARPTPVSRRCCRCDSDITIPADLEAEVHSQSAVGEQYVELLPRSGDAAAAEGRRRDPASTAPRCRPTSTRCWTPPTVACRRSRRTT